MASAVKSTQTSLRFSPDILRRLGEELIPSVDQGILELVRNAYDADAVTCRVELINVAEPGGTLRVADDGDGMTDRDIEDGWLVLGRSQKSGRPPTRRLGRLPVGDKGLGRLAALRLGRRANLVTRPRTARGRQYEITLDWSRFENAQVVEDVALEIDTAETHEPHGTVIEVKELDAALSRREVDRLARSLVLLADPFTDQSGFHPVLIAPGFADLEERVRDAYFDIAEFKLKASIDEQGFGRARVTDRAGRQRWSGKHKDLRGGDDAEVPYKTSPASFEFWAFNLNPTFAPGAPIADVKKWLEAVGGVHLYHRGLRVHPYGDPGHDWLDLNLRRAQNPELRPSTNTSVGRLLVPDPREQLVQKTDRSGFIEDEPFLDLRQFARDALEWMASARLKERESERPKEKATSRSRVAEARERVDDTIKEVPARARQAVRRAITQLETARDQEAKLLREEVQLYRTLGTIGTTAAVFAHESAKPVTQIERAAQLIANRGVKLLGEQYELSFATPVGHMIAAARALRTFASLPLRLLARERRRLILIDIHATIQELVTIFAPFLEDARIDLKLRLADANPRVRGTTSAIDSIVSNLITNAIYSLETGGGTGRTIRITTELQDSAVVLTVADSGRGIERISTEDMWLPGKTTKRGGTGLGLTIVRDSVSDLGGNAFAIAHGDLGGAEFVIGLPTVTDT